MTMPADGSFHAVTIVGAGGMGTALAVLLARTTNSVRLWARDADRAADTQLRRENTRHLPGVALPGTPLFRGPRTLSAPLGDGPVVDRQRGCTGR